MKLLWLLLLLPSVALADTWAVASLASYHFDRGEHCERNAGLGFEHGATWRAVGGFYRNSDCRTSWYAGGSYTPLQAGPWRAGMVGIVATGYEDSPLIAPGGLLAFEGRRFGLNLILFPNKRGRFDRGVVGLQVKVRW